MKNVINLVLLLTCLSWGVLVHAAHEQETAEQVLAKYLAAIGGKKTWANAKGEYVLAKVTDPNFPYPGTFEFCWSWTELKTSARSRFQDFTLVRVFDGEKGWTYRNAGVNDKGSLQHWDAKRAERGLREWQGNLEILTHRLAKDDPEVSVEMAEVDSEHWLLIKLQGEPVGRLLTDETGAPKSYHRILDGFTIDFGPLVDRANFRFPLWGAFQGGEPFDLITFEMLNEAPTIAFDQEKVVKHGFLDCR